VSSVDGYHDLRQFALHRIREVRVLDEPAELHATFDVDDYIDTGIFNHRQADTQVELVADVHPQIAALLSETPLSSMQSLSDLPEQGWKRLHAQVSLDRDTLWWIFGLNDNIRVHAPQVWVDEIRQKLNNLRALYSDADPASI
jgi:predicted DNA-binding transcriptional regulator YafY